MSEPEFIRFEIDLQRVIELLAKQIYQSPLALLRENAQNAFDAVLMRQFRGDQFEPRIDIGLESSAVTIRDNGIGMTPADLKEHYWRAGASGKNNPEARAAGVVGTFGIGAMANFGIAEDLLVETESAITGERTSSHAQRSTLSASEDCIDITPLPPTGDPGTSITARFAPDTTIDVGQARSYIADFVAYLPIPVAVNGEIASGKTVADAIPRPQAGRAVSAQDVHLGASFTGDMELVVTPNAEVWASLTKMSYGGKPLAGELVVRSGMGALRSFRSGFGLATTAVSSFYGFGGVANMRDLQPTAGREALSTESAQLLQTLISEIDNFVSETLASMEESDASTSFMTWVHARGRYELCGRLRMRLEPDGRDLELEEVRARTQLAPMPVYGGSDATILAAYASDDSPLLVYANRQPRRQCEEEYLRRFCAVETVSDQPKLLEEKPRMSWTLAESALAFRVGAVLSTDYFLDAGISFGKISHSLPVLVIASSEPTRIVLDPTIPTIAMVIELYKTDSPAFGGMVKDFVRNVIFPRVADLVPSSTRQGAEAFLRTIQKTRDIFEYEGSDLDNLTSIWEDYLEGRLTMSEAAERSTAFVSQSIQIVDASVSRPVADVVPDVVANEAAFTSSDSDALDGPLPPITRLEVSSDAKLLSIISSDPPLRGFRCFLALSDRVRLEKGDFFLQPHTTAVAWGGQKVMFIFQHHSGRFGLYYDIQTPNVVAAKTSGSSFTTCTIVLKNRVFIPIPESIQEAFIPLTGERRRLEVRCDVIYIDGEGV